MKVLSLFSGVGGFDLGLEAAGMETVAMCEWDKKAASVLRRHWPQIPIYGDVSDLTGAQLLADGVLPDLVAFGSPCQDLSVAGKRAGLAGERSGLFHEAVRIIRELRTLTDGALPRWIIWENVVGALNSNGGADFQAVLDQMGDLGACFSEWAVLDAQNYGVPQRRRRVFLVSCLDPGAARECPDPLLPIGKGRPRDLVPIRQAWKDSPAGARGRSPGTIARAHGFGKYTLDDRTGTLKTRGNHADIDYVIIDAKRAGDVRVHDEPVDTLTARMGTGGGNVPIIMRQREGKPGGGKGPLLSEESLTLATRNDQYLFQSGQVFTKAARAQSATDGETWVDGEVSPTLNTFDNGGESRATVLNVYGIQATAIDRQHHNGPQGSGITPEDGSMFTLNTVDRHAVATPYMVGRLLPIECERLMGWPDDWTRWDAEGKEQADSHRYKQTGNGVASPVAEWVGRQIFAADARRPQ